MKHPKAVGAASKDVRNFGEDREMNRRPLYWGDYEYDREYDYSWVAVYSNEERKKVFISMSGELSHDTVKQVGWDGAISKENIDRYRDIIPLIILKYKE